MNFLTMTCGRSPVRRLSTVSSVTKPPHFILTTEWLWYWSGELGQWIEYGQEVGPINTSSSCPSENNTNNCIKMLLRGTLVTAL